MIITTVGSVRPFHLTAPEVRPAAGTSPGARIGDEMTYQTPAPARRPAGVTLLAVLIVISGLLGLFGSIALIIGRGSDEFVRSSGVQSGTLLWVGVVGVIIALVYLAVARGLTRGSGLARGLAALVAVLSLGLRLLSGDHPPGQPAVHRDRLGGTGRHRADPALLAPGQRVLPFALMPLPGQLGPCG